MLEIVILTVSNCFSSQQCGHLVQLHLLMQASQPRTCLQHVDIINAGYVNPLHDIQLNTSFNGITS